jgi:hypothetical protein
MITRLPTSNVTPDPAQGGSAVASPANDAHGGTTSVSVGGGSQVKSYKSSGFANLSGGRSSVILKADYSDNGTIANNGSNQFRIESSIDGGGSWQVMLNHNNITSPTTSSVQRTLSTSQDLSLVQVRDKIQATSIEPGDSGSITASISNIKIEVQTIDGGVIICT